MIAFNDLGDGYPTLPEFVRMLIDYEAEVRREHAHTQNARARDADAERLSGPSRHASRADGASVNEPAALFASDQQLDRHHGKILWKSLQHGQSDVVTYTCKRCGSIYLEGSSCCIGG